MEMKKIQEVLNEYSIELKSADRHITVYACKRVEQKNKSKVSVKRSATFCDTTQQSNLIL
jgi:hypothetical protein